MSILNKILKKKESEKKVVEKVEKKETVITEKKQVSEKRPLPQGKIVLGVLVAPHITEKSTALSKYNKYIFKVTLRANKILTKQAVEAKYGVRVESVRVLNTSGKERRRGRIIGHKPGFKKAVVTLAEGYNIELT
ncbi:MAG: 50S ribosomal protein L23 [Candidatus Sungiibacteriota bacterium]|uniref:Large ribosomal subunit protein uL23 n=1 Tax=Candidatus Sungiibacteriota bacterium TaxID=2750080 RepID=A0A7T5RJ15_9BACT|nr:MAG: 50S ribosomal protein L23 [Candidatus Sungbacteria bacterium]